MMVNVRRYKKKQDLNVFLQYSPYMSWLEKYKDVYLSLKNKAISESRSKIYENLYHQLDIQDQEKRTKTKYW